MDQTDENGGEAVRAAPGALECEARGSEASLSALRLAIDEGDASGIAGRDAFARVRRKLRISAGRR